MSTELSHPRRGVTSEETALATREETSRELAPTSGAAAAQFEIQSAITVARKFPRNEDKAFGSLMKSCGRLSFAECAAYSFPRGGQAVEGPSVNLAREGARVWGNIRYGCDVVSDDEETRHIRGWAWDLESNTKVCAEDSFAKLIFRKKGGWQKPDERDLRELTNRRGAILERNCLLKLLPPDLVEEALARSKQTLTKGVSDDMEGQRKKTILAFGALGVSVEQLEVYLGHPLAQVTPAEIADLRTVYKSIMDGNSKWAEYVADKATPSAPPASNGPVKASDLSGAAVSPTTAQAPAPADNGDQVREVLASIKNVGTLTDVGTLYDRWCGPESTLGEEERQAVSDVCEARRNEIRAARAGRKVGE